MSLIPTLTKRCGNLVSSGLNNATTGQNIVTLARIMVTVARIWSFLLFAIKQYIFSKRTVFF